VHLIGAKANRITSKRKIYIPYWSWESQPSRTFFDIARKTNSSFQKVKYYTNQIFFIWSILLSAINLCSMYLIKLYNKSFLTQDMIYDPFFQGYALMVTLIRFHDLLRRQTTCVIYSRQMAVFIWKQIKNVLYILYLWVKWLIIWHPSVWARY
jgi:hypothetical protein